MDSDHKSKTGHICSSPIRAPPASQRRTSRSGQFLSLCKAGSNLNLTTRASDSIPAAAEGHCLHVRMQTLLPCPSHPRAPCHCHTAVPTAASSFGSQGLTASSGNPSLQALALLCPFSPLLLPPCPWCVRDCADQVPPLLSGLRPWPPRNAPWSHSEPK